MTEFKLVHRPARLPGADPETDLTVLCDGRLIARVMRVDQGERAGMWVSGDNRGIASTRDDALAEVKRRVCAETFAALPPVR